MGDLKSGETFEDRVYITDADGVAAAGLTTTCKFYDEEGNETVGTTAELGNGLYHCTDFTPDANGTWNTVWGVTDEGTYIIHHQAKEFKVGGGSIDDVETKVDVIDEYHDVPAADAVLNAQMNEVIGNKTDAPGWFMSDTRSLISYAKAAAIRAAGISYAAKCNTGMGASTTTIVCDDLIGFGDDFFNTDWVMEVALNDNSHGNAPEGNAPRDVQDYDSATGTFTVAAFTANVEEEDRVIVSKRHLQVTDKTAIAASPTVDSLAYKISQFIADGDGDFATGTPLPSNTSLYDVLVRHEVTKTFFSPSQISVTVTAGASDLSLPTVTLPNITGTITHVYAGIKFRMIENTNGAANKLDGAQDIQVRVDTPGAWADAINFVDDQFGLAASTREGGDCVIGNIDLVGTVTAFNDGYEFQWDEAVADLANIVLNDVQTFLIVSYY